MITFDRENKELKFQQIDDSLLKIDILQDIKYAYKRYLDKVIYEDMKYFMDKCVKLDDISVQVANTPTISTYGFGSVDRVPNKYYPVSIKREDGETAEIFRIPFLDETGKVIIDSKRYVIINKQVPDEDVTYNDDKHQLDVQLPTSKVSLQCSDSKLSFRLKKADNIDAITLAKAMMFRDNMEDGEVSDYLLNDFVSSIYTKDEYAINESSYIKMSQNSDVLNNLESERFKLGRTREALDKLLNFNTLINNDILAEDVLDKDGNVIAREGTVATKQLVKKLYKNNIGMIKVKSTPAVIGKYLCLPNDMYINSLPAGTKVGAFLAQYLEELTPVLEEDTTFDPPIVIDKRMQITEDLLEFYQECVPLDYIPCLSSKSSQAKNVSNYRFCREIITNCRVKYGDVYDNDIPAGHKYDEYYYFGHKKDNYDPDYLNIDDILALISLISRTYIGIDSIVPDKDKMFMKKIDTIDKSFSKAFRDTINKLSSKTQEKITKFVMGHTNECNVQRVINSTFKKTLRDSKILVEEDTKNLVAEISQVRHVAFLGDASTVSDEQRQIAISMFGRICPYETPAGQKLGVVNSQAVGSRVNEFGQIEVPYRQVIKMSGDKIKLANRITWLTSSDEIDKRIGDIMDLVPDPNEEGTYLPVMLKAKVPNIDVSGEKVVFENILSSQLDFVTVSPEQHLSMTVSMMPFVGHNDAVRASFGSGMLKQTVYIPKSEAPAVSTDMYRMIFDCSDEFLIKAKDDGVVKTISPNKLTVIYDSEVNPTNIKIIETRTSRESFVTKTYMFNEGERFKKGDILVSSWISKDGIYSTARNELVAFIPTGYNYEDALEISEELSINYTSVTPSKVSKLYKKSQVNSVTTPNVNRFNVIKSSAKIPGIMVKHIDKKGNVSDMIEDTNVRAESGGILMGIDTVDQVNKDTLSLTANLLQFNPIEKGDKMTGRHGNKGVVSKITKNSEMPQFPNGEHVNIIVNIHGMPSRMTLGVNLEAPLSFMVKILGLKTAVSNSFNGATVDEVKKLVAFVYDVANNGSTAFDSSKHTNIPNNLKEYCKDNLESIQNWAGCFDLNGDARLWDPQTGTWFPYPITVGYNNMLKLVHEVDHKVHSRAGLLNSQYQRITDQPPKGSKRGGGQRMGEMELVAFLAYGTTEYLWEIMNIRSDNTIERAQYHLDLINGNSDSPRIMPDIPHAPRSVEALTYLLEAANIDLEIDEYGKFDSDFVYSKYDVNLKDYLDSYNTEETVVEEPQKSEEISSLKDIYRML